MLGIVAGVGNVPITSRIEEISKTQYYPILQRRDIQGMQKSAAALYQFFTPMGKSWRCAKGVEMVFALTPDKGAILKAQERLTKKKEKQR